MMSSALALVAILAVVQGITEFLPVSSSGHLALVQMLTGRATEDGGLVLEIVLHLGTLVAVSIFYRRDLGHLLAALARADAAGRSARHYVGLLLLANIPAGLVGVLLKDRIESAFGSAAFVLGAMALTGVVLMSTRGAASGADRGDTLSVDPIPLRTALWMGVAQAFAIMPGLSRSGWTIAAGLRSGLEPAAAARFSFLMSMPAIGGAALLSLRDAESMDTGWGVLLLGFVVSAIVGYLCLSWLLRIVRGMQLYRFAWYLWAVSACGVLLLLTRGGS